MSLIVRLGCVTALTASGCIPFALEMFKSSEDKWGEFVFTKTSGGAKV